jgi:hypothetical protein
MSMRIVLAAALVTAGCAVAVAQSSTATSGTTQPMTSAPASDTLPNGQPKWQPPPAARSGEKGLPVGPDAFKGDTLEVKRLK